MHAATPTIFSEHEVFVDCCHSNKTIYIFCVLFSKTEFKKCENNGKRSVLILVLLTNICFVIHIPNVSLNLV